MSDLEQMRHEVRQRLIEENEFPHIPTNWGVERLRFLFTESKERNGNSPVGEMLSVSEYRGVVPREYENEEQKRTDDELENYRVVRPGQLAVNSMWLNHLGLGVSEHTGHVSPAYNVYDISDRLDRRFVHHLMRSNYYLKIYLRYLYGIRPNSFQIKSNDWASIPIIAPDLATQRQIADFLDRETARIDLLVEKKQQLVALLGEKAKAKKLDLVTGQRRGEQKETSILWAPSIPQHWEERAVWMLFELGRGRVMSHEYIAENEGEYPIYSSQTANYGVMGYINTYDFEGDYLTWTTDGAKAGTVFRRRGKFNCTNVCGTLRPLTRSIDLNYAQVALDTATDFFVRHDINPKLMNGVMSKIRIPYPPLDEQRMVGDAIDQIEQSYKPILEKNQTSIDRFKEYRSALITAAVTGQIDVSTYAKSGTPDRRLDAIQEEMGA